MASTDENIKVVYNSESHLMIVLGDHGVQITHEEGIQLLQDLGAALQDQWNTKEGKKNLAEEANGV